MPKMTRETLFKPKAKPAENKTDAIYRAAKAIIDHDAALRDAKTARLREARLAKETAAPAKPNLSRK